MPSSFILSHTHTARHKMLTLESQFQPKHLPFAIAFLPCHGFMRHNWQLRLCWPNVLSSRCIRYQVCYMELCCLAAFNTQFKMCPCNWWYESRRILSCIRLNFSRICRWMQSTYPQTTEERERERKCLKLHFFSCDCISLWASNCWWKND